MIAEVPITFSGNADVNGNGNGGSYANESWRYLAEKR